VPVPADNADAPCYAATMTSPIASLCLFCGSKPGTDPRHLALAEAFGGFCAAQSLTLVYGGGGLGLMGAAARAALAGGGRVVGILPQCLVEAEVAQAGLSELRIAPTLHARKAEMHDRSDAIVVLPGGIGTFDELFEVMTWRNLGLHDKPIWLLGAASYWEPFLAFLRHLDAEGFAYPRTLALIEALDGLDTLAERVAASRIGPSRIGR